MASDTDTECCVSSCEKDSTRVIEMVGRTLYACAEHEDGVVRRSSRAGGRILETRERVSFKNMKEWKV